MGLASSEGDAVELGSPVEDPVGLASSEEDAVGIGSPEEMELGSPEEEDAESSSPAPCLADPETQLDGHIHAFAISFLWIIFQTYDLIWFFGLLQSKLGVSVLHWIHNWDHLTPSLYTLFFLS